MSVLYKYRDPARINDLRARTIRITPPGEFNDPFEALPGVAGAWSPSTLEALVAETHRVAALDGVTLNAAEVRAEFEGQNLLATELGTEWIGKLANELFGVVSLSETPTEPLMWAHYAADHTGFVIGFDAEHEWWRRNHKGDDPTEHLVPVTYSAVRPKVFLDAARFGDTGQQAQWAADVFGTKSEHWHYEHEVRLVTRLAHADVVDRGRGIHLLKVPEEVVTEVVLGFRMSYADRAAIREILDDPAYRHVRLLRARISRDRYEIELEAV
jgi:hypothetical protein